MGIVKKIGGGIAKDYMKYKFERSNIPLGDGQYVPSTYGVRAAKSAYGLANNMSGGALHNAAKPALNKIQSGLSNAGFKSGPSVIGKVVSNPLVRGAGLVASGKIGRVGAAARQIGNLKENNKVVNMTKMSSVYKAYEEMKELEKEAEFNFGDSLKHHAVSNAVSLAAPAAILAGKKIYDKVQTERTWKKVIARSPELNTPDAREHFEVMQQFSPAIASNPTTARSYLQRTMHTGMVPHEFVKDLVSVQDTKSKGGFASAAMDATKGQRFSDSMRAVADSKRQKEEFGYKKDRDASMDARDDAKQKYQQDKDVNEFERKDKEFSYRKTRDRKDDKRNDSQFGHRADMDFRKDFREESDFQDRQDAKASRAANLSKLEAELKKSNDPNAKERWQRIQERLATGGGK